MPLPMGALPRGFAGSEQGLKQEASSRATHSEPILFNTILRKEEHHGLIGYVAGKKEAGVSGNIFNRPSARAALAGIADMLVKRFLERR